MCDDIKNAAIAELRGMRRWPFYHRLYAWSQLFLILATVLIGYAVTAGKFAEAGVLIALVIAGIYPVICIFVWPGNETSVAR